MTSFRAIAERMDPEFPSNSLRGLLAQHVESFDGTRPSEPSSLREICARHERSESISLLFQNTFLIIAGQAKVVCDYLWPMKDTTLYSKEAFRADGIDSRLPLIAARLAQSEYDILALSEVFTDNVLDPILNAARSNGSLSDFRQGPMNSGVLPDIPLPLPPCPPSLIFPHAPGIPKLRVPLGDSGLLTTTRRHSIIDSEAVAFDNAGSFIRDIDSYSSKGVLKTAIDVGPGIISIFSTHLYNGGDWIEDPTEEQKDAVKLDQIQQLVGMVQLEQRTYPERVCIVGGDFNRQGNDLMDERYLEFVRLMATAGLSDLWVERAKDASGTVSLGPTSISASTRDLEETRAQCPVSRDGGTTCNEQMTVANGSRIDYVFVQSPVPEHTITVDYRRPLRVYMEASPTVEGLSFLSDHFGLDVQLYVNPR